MGIIMPRLMITLNQIKEQYSCSEGWETLFQAKAYDTPFPVSDILDIDGFYYPVLTVMCFPEHIKLWAFYAAWCARHVNHLIEKEMSKPGVHLANEYLPYKNIFQPPYDFKKPEDIKFTKVVNKVMVAEGTVPLAEDIILLIFKAYQLEIKYMDKNYKIEAKLRQILDAGEWV